MKKLFTVLLLASALFMLPASVQSSGSSLTTNQDGSGQVRVVRGEDGVLYLSQEIDSDTNTRKTYLNVGDTEILIPEGFFTSFDLLFNRVLRFVIAAAALLAFGYLIWGGIDWITSGGDKGKTEQARQKITSAVVGLIVVAASYAILTLALNFIGIESLDDALDKSIYPDVYTVETETATKSGELD